DHRPLPDQRAAGRGQRGDQPAAAVHPRGGRHPLQMRRRRLRHLPLPDRGGARPPRPGDAAGAAAPRRGGARRGLADGLPGHRHRRCRGVLAAGL
ncbi:MAG: hypothetical protein AVDCRST_MAG27-223, partial [uncultured Craurococcus sp.]